MTAIDLETSALDYHLPPERIAVRPAEPRDSARMMVVCRSDPSRVQHMHVRDLPGLLNPGDCLVQNEAAVIPARIHLQREGGTAILEGLFLEEPSPGTWRVMLRSRGRVREGQALRLLDHRNEPSSIVLHVKNHEGERWIVEVKAQAGDVTMADARTILHMHGRTPLPPYIRTARHSGNGAREAFDDSRERQWYQTVYADRAHASSVAAPTAGLHFTDDLLKAIESRGVQRAMLTLDVGMGTFKPVTAANLREHDMHAETFRVPRRAIETIRAARERGGRIIAVGTTSVRALESLPEDIPGHATDAAGSTRLLIAPGHQFRLVDGLLTNFHLPKSTLLALVAALVGLDRLQVLYRDAVEREYRFYSYGDAMLILP